MCHRINGRGVDINRNYVVDHGIRERDYNPSEEYGGVSPLSEPESKCTLSIIQNRRPHIIVNVHSGMHAILTPWDHEPRVVSGHEKDLQLMSELNQKFCSKKCSFGPGAKVVQYAAHGTLGDHVMTYLKPILYFTYEIYGEEVDFEECYQQFNPQTPFEMHAISESYSEAMLYVMHEVLYGKEYDFANLIKTNPSIFNLVDNSPKVKAPAFRSKFLSELQTSLLGYGSIIVLLLVCAALFFNVGSLIRKCILSRRRVTKKYRSSRL